MPPAMRRMLEWLGLTDTVDEYESDYTERPGQQYEPEPEQQQAPRNSNVQVFAEGGDRRQPTQLFAPPERMPRAPEPDYREQRIPAYAEPVARHAPAEEPLRGFNASSSIKPVPAPSAKPSVHILYPKRFRDATEVADLMRDGQPVIVNLQNAERDLPRRMIDFCSGVTYALEGKMERVAESVFLLTPSNVVVTQEERDNLSERGIF